MNLKDYLHLYMGCDVMLWADATNPVFKPEKKKLVPGQTTKPDHISLESAFFCNAKPLLRPLTSMNRGEAEELIKCNPFYEKHDVHVDSVSENTFIGIRFSVRYNGSGRWWNKTQSISTDLRPEQFHYLVSNGFDLFGLIDAGLALDKTTVKK